MLELGETDLSNVSAEVREKASRIKLLLMDVDGVLTDGKLFYSLDGQGNAQEFKAFNSQDGLGLHMLRKAGIATGVISGRQSMATTERARILAMKYVYQGHLEKIPIFEEILAAEGISAENVAFVGDDFTDAPLVQRAGLGCAVSDARPELRRVADFVTRACGGNGAIREVAELILQSSFKWQDVLAHYELA